jgi:hypothetical protein
LELSGPTIEVRERGGDVVGSVVVPVARRVCRRDEFEVLSLLLPFSSSLLVVTVTMAAAPPI